MLAEQAIADVAINLGHLVNDILIDAMAAQVVLLLGSEGEDLAGGAQLLKHLLI